MNILLMTNTYKPLVGGLEKSVSPDGGTGGQKRFSERHRAEQRHGEFGPGHRSRSRRSFAGFLRGGLVLPFGCHELFGGPLRASQNPASRIALRAQKGKSRLEIYFGRIQIFKNQSHHRPGDNSAFHHGTGRLGLPIPAIRLRGNPIADGRPRLWLAFGPEWPRRLYRRFIRRRPRISYRPR